MINYNEYDIETTDWIEENDRCGVDDEQVWEIASQCEEIPSFENILIRERFKALESYIHDTYGEDVEVDFNANCRASSVSIKVADDWATVNDYTDIEDEFISHIHWIVDNCIDDTDIPKDIAEEFKDCPNVESGKKIKAWFNKDEEDLSDDVKLQEKITATKEKVEARQKKSQDKKASNNIKR